MFIGLCLSRLIFLYVLVGTFQVTDHFPKIKIVFFGNLSPSCAGLKFLGYLVECLAACSSQRICYEELAGPEIGVCLLSFQRVDRNVQLL